MSAPPTAGPGLSPAAPRVVSASVGSTPAHCTTPASPLPCGKSPHRRQGAMTPWGEPARSKTSTATEDKERACEDSSQVTQDSTLAGDEPFADQSGPIGSSGQKLSQIDNMTPSLGRSTVDVATVTITPTTKESSTVTTEARVAVESKQIHRARSRTHRSTMSRHAASTQAMTARRKESIAARAAARAVSAYAAARAVASCPLKDDAQIVPGPSDSRVQTGGASPIAPPLQPSQPSQPPQPLPSQPQEPPVPTPPSQLHRSASANKHTRTHKAATTNAGRWRAPARSQRRGTPSSRHSATRFSSVSTEVVLAPHPPTESTPVTTETSTSATMGTKDTLEEPVSSVETAEEVVDTTSEMAATEPSHSHSSQGTSSKPFLNTVASMPTNTRPTMSARSLNVTSSVAHSRERLRSRGHDMDVEVRRSRQHHHSRSHKQCSLRRRRREDATATEGWEAAQLHAASYNGLESLPLMVFVWPRMSADAMAAAAAAAAAVAEAASSALLTACAKVSQPLARERRAAINAVRWLWRTLHVLAMLHLWPSEEGLVLADMLKLPHMRPASPAPAQPTNTPIMLQEFCCRRWRRSSALHRQLHLLQPLASHMHTSLCDRVHITETSDHSGIVNASSASPASVEMAAATYL